MNLCRHAIATFVLLATTRGAPAAPDAPAAYVYDVPADGPVHVTVQPRRGGPLTLPVTAENVRADGLEFALRRDWEAFACEATITAAGPDATLHYDWPDGALPWPVRLSNWLPQSEKRWFADCFRVTGPAEVAILLPPGTKVMELRERDCPQREEQTADGRVRVVFDVPAGRTVHCMGVIFERPWADVYAVYGESPVPVYYPKVLERHPEYMQRVRRLYDAAREFHRTYADKLKFQPDFDIAQYAINWLQGYGGAFCTGASCYFDYRRVACFEWPPQADGGRLMGAYHEMAHCFQPEGLPDYMGGHVWTAWLTMKYDFESFPTPAEVAARKAAGKKADAHLVEAYRVYRGLHDSQLVPPLWEQWPETDTERDARIQRVKPGEHPLHLRELACAYVMLVLERELGAPFWGRAARVCRDCGLQYEGIPAPAQHQIVAAQLSAAAGRDLVPRLTKLTDCALEPPALSESANLVQPEAWTLDAWQPGASFERDEPWPRSGSARSLKLICPAANDARLIQKVPVAPRTLYVISAVVRTADVPTGCSGATVGVFPDPASLRVTGTHGWRRLGRIVYSEDRNELTVALRVGWQGGPTAGTAWFDDIQVVPLFSQAGWRLLTANAD